MSATATESLPSHSLRPAHEQAGATAPTRTHGEQPSRRALWGGRIMTAIPVLFLIMDALMKVLQAPQAMEGTEQLGYPTSVLLPLGVVQLICMAFYLFPRTSVLGAILWTGYLGGAIATHVRLGNPLFTHVLFPVYLAVFLWGGLWLRNPRLRALLPLILK